jgi:hypothetical protein
MFAGVGCNILVCVKAQAAGPTDLITWGDTILTIIIEMPLLV